MLDRVPCILDPGFWIVNGGMDGCVEGSVDSSVGHDRGFISPREKELGLKDVVEEGRNRPLIYSQTLNLNLSLTSNFDLG